METSRPSAGKEFPHGKLNEGAKDGSDGGTMGRFCRRRRYRRHAPGGRRCESLGRAEARALFLFWP